jgi:hypothetical protein
MEYCGSQRQIQNAAFEFVWFHALCYQSQIINHLTDRYRVLVAEDDAAERNPALLSPMCFDKKVMVERDDRPSEFGGSIEQIRIGRLIAAVILCPHNIDAAGPQLLENRPENVNVKIEPHAHN